MTAEVAILNTHGIALATDSAITISASGERKVYNTANKLFMLSKYHPVGIMIYNKAGYMGIDWEIIIKEYRKSIKNKPLPKLFDYAESFINYVKKLSYITEERQKDIFLSICVSIISRVQHIFFHEIENRFKLVEKITLKQASQVLDSVSNNILLFQKKNTKKTNYIFDIAFLKRYKNHIYEIIDEAFEKYKVSIKQKESILKIIISDFSNAYELNHSGIVIAGYGDKEIFPSIYQCEICGKIGKSFVSFNEMKKSISFNYTATIMPFAQSEMVHTFMRGIDPNLEDIIDKQLEDIMISISNITGSSYKHKLIDIKKEFMKHLDESQHEFYINPIMDIVESLQKTDLAEMAETLVNLTAFKRHISKNAETVGGPTDVAVITKGDGFVWIKRKQYFDIKFNRFFQQKYFMEDVK